MTAKLYRPRYDEEFRAMQYDGTNADDIATFLGCEITMRHDDGTVFLRHPTSSTGSSLRISEWVRLGRAGLPPMAFDDAYFQLQFVEVEE